MFRFLHLQGGFTEWKEKADPSEIEWFFFYPSHIERIKVLSVTIGKG